MGCTAAKARFTCGCGGGLERADQLRGQRSRNNTAAAGVRGSSNLVEVLYATANGAMGQERRWRDQTHVNLAGLTAVTPIGSFVTQSQ